MAGFHFDSLPYRAKILAYAALVATISLALVSLAFLIQDSVTYRVGFIRNAEGKAELLARTCASAVGFHDPDFANRVLAGLDASPEVASAAIYVDDGSLLAAYSDGAAGVVPDAPPEAGSFRDGHLETVVAIEFQGMQVGMLFMRSEMPNRWSRLSRFGLLLLVVAALALALSLWMSRFFNKSLIRPIAELEDTARRVSSDRETSVRARKFSDDELGRLTDTVNEMLARIEERESALVESEERFSGLLDRLGEAVFRLTVPEFVCEYCSAAADDVFGYPAGEFLKRPGILLEIVHPDSRDFVAQELARLEDGSAARVWEYKIIDAGGQERWILQTNAFQRDADGRVTALEACCTDITQRRLAAAEKRRLEAELQQAHKLEALGTLAGGIAHDFNNILEAILGYTDLSAMDLPADHPVQEFLRQVNQAGRRAAGMVRKILTFSRQTDAGKAQVELSQVVGEALGLIRPSLPVDVEVLADLPPDLVPALADPNQIHQVVMNLCTNAGHAMEDGGGTLRVEVRQVGLAAGHSDLTGDMEPGDHLQLTISDTGPGIDPAIRERVFEPFFTTKPPGKGTGMGLAMVYGIVLDHGGNIILDTEPGRGTTFRVLVPSARAEVAAEPADTPQLAPGTGRVLFVDDEEMLVTLVERVLGSLGYEVTGTTSPDKALDLFSNDPAAFDVVVTDMTMPGMSGMELAERVVAMRPGVPVVVCSGNPPQDMKNDGERIGIFAFAQKPLTVDQLGKLVHRAMAKVQKSGRPG